MSVVRPLRRRTRRSLVVLARVYAVLLFFVALLVGVAVYVFITSPSLRAKNVIVRSSEHVSAAQIRAAAGIDPATNVWLLDTHAIARRMEAIPYVDHAVVARAFPAEVILDVRERREWACIAGATARATVDERARVLRAGCSPLLPLVRSPRAVVRPGSFVADPTARTLMRDEARLAPLLAPHVLALDRYGSLEATLGDGTLLRFGSDSDLEAKASLVRPIVAAAQSRTHRVRAIDLRAPGTPVVAY